MSCFLCHHVISNAFLKLVPFLVLGGFCQGFFPSLFFAFGLISEFLNLSHLLVISLRSRFVSLSLLIDRLFNRDLFTAL